jgi:hypothetical protein
MKLRIVPTSLACAACASLPADARCPERCPRNFVLTSWSSSLKHSRDAGPICSEDYPSVMNAQIAKWCARPECRVLLGVDLSVDADTFVGFIAGEPLERVVYYVFVKPRYQRRGAARALFTALGIDPIARFAYPCTTKMLDDPKIGLSRKVPNAVRDPFVARFPKSQRDRSYA